MTELVRIDLKDRAVWLHHVIAEIHGVERGSSRPVVALQFDVPISGAVAGPNGQVHSGPAMMELTPEETAIYLAAVEEFTVELDEPDEDDDGGDSPADPPPAPKEPANRIRSLARER